ncbi:MAG: hypothetical protein CME71_12870 [Halobacteriovorax sp.]|nr:hypothetical protein [Halobacteriovorax sp.]|tara:strand:- start:902 stop:2284 length:1383 start_codon:yes stop_codon:yes gene_type:complete
MLLLGFGRAAQMIIMFASYRLLSSFFTKAEMSSYYFLLSIAGLFGLIIANPIGMYLNRIIHQSKNHKQLNSVVLSFFKAMTILSLVTVPIVFIFQTKLSNDDLSILIIALALLVFVLGATLNGTFVSILNILSEDRAFVILTTLTALIGLSLSVVGVKFILLNPIIWILGQGIALAVFGLVALILICKKIDPDTSSFKLDKDQIIKFSMPILFTNIFVWIMSQSFRFFLKGNVDDSLLGEMAFGLGLATALAVAVEYLFQQLLFPSFYAALGDDKLVREDSWNKLFSKSAPAFICLTIYMITLSPFIISLLADSKFHGAFVFFALGAVVELFRMLGNMVNMAYQSEMRTKDSILSYVYGGLVTLCGIVFISHNPENLYYTPFVLILGQFTIFSSLFLRLRKIITINYPVKALLKFLFLGLLLLPALFFRKDPNLIISVVVCSVCGLYLLFLFYQIQKEKA